MLSNLDPASQRFLADLNRIQANNTAAQQQLSSGFKVEAASDAPDQIGTLLQLEAERGSNTQTLANLGRVQTEVKAADDSLTTAVQLFDKITQLASEGLSADTVQQRALFAEQIQSYQAQLVAVTATTVEGRYIFDGGDGTGPPYQYSATVPNGAIQLRSTPATRQVQDSVGSVFPYARSAEDIFDPRDSSGTATANNVFAAIGQALSALNANDTSAIGAAIDSLHTAATYLGAQQTFYGTVQNRLSTALNTSESLDVSLKTQISSIRDADTVEASLAVNRGNLQEQAALAAEAKRQTKTLFDYLA